MQSPVVGGLLTFVGGCLVAYVNYLINRYALRKRPQLLGTLSFVRQLLNVAYFVAVFLLGKALPWDQVPLLVGAAVGLTVPSVLLALHLAKLNDARSDDVPAAGDFDSEGEDQHG